VFISPLHSRTELLRRGQISTCAEAEWKKVSDEFCPGGVFFSFPPKAQ
jgi:hypothetical protein